MDVDAARLADYSGEAFAFLTSPNSTNEEPDQAQPYAPTARKSH